jgi:hypothetical protein
MSSSKKDVKVRLFYTFKNNTKFIANTIHSSNSNDKYIFNYEDNFLILYKTESGSYGN